MELKTRKGLEKWLKTQPRDVAVILAARAAMRASPFLYRLHNSPALQSRVSNIILPLFYGKATALFAGTWSNKVVDAHSATANADSAFAAVVAGDFDVAATEAAFAAVAAVAATDANTGAATADAFAADVALAADAAADAAFAAAHADTDFWKALSKDCTFISKGNTAQKLANKPLWDQGWKGAPESVLTVWHDLRTQLENANQDWKVWIEWYEARIAGGTWLSQADLEHAKLKYLAENYEDEPSVVNAELTRLTALFNPPHPHKQEYGPQYGIDDTGNEPRIRNIPAFTDDPDTDWDMIEALHPGLLDAATSLASLMGNGNNAYPIISKLAKDYAAMVNGSVRDIPYAQLTGLGMRLANAEAAAQRDISSRQRPELEDDEKEALSSLLDLHGPFILSSREGMNIVAKAERYDRKPAEDQKLKDNSHDIALALEDENLVSEDTGENIRDAVELMNSGEQPERGTIYGSQVIRNVLGTTTAAGFISLSALLLSSGSIIGGLLGGLVSLVSLQGIAKSKFSEEWAEKIKNAMDGVTELSDSDVEKLYQDSNKFRKFADFVIRHEDKLRQIAGTRREFKWLHDQIDWIKRYHPDFRH